MSNAYYRFAITLLLDLALSFKRQQAGSVNLPYSVCHCMIRFSHPSVNMDGVVRTKLIGLYVGSLEILHAYSSMVYLHHVEITPARTPAFLAPDVHTDEEWLFVTPQRQMSHSVVFESISDVQLFSFY